jgi:predicted AlkP superfamily pyrophosphatase or phosphodiesterase
MTLFKSLRTCLVALVIPLATALLTSCAAPQTPLTPSSQILPPKLLVFIVVDGLPQRQITSYRDQLAPDGFARFLDRGIWFSNANYGHSFTVTAAGHAVMLTGAYPNRTGVIGNEWRNPETGVPVYNTEDTSATYIGHTTRAFDGTSPKNLKVPTVGDMLRAASPESKVIAISGKDRGAILPAGKRGIAYMYMAESGGFASTTHYMAQHPVWVNTYNAAKPADRYFKSEWKALLPETAYARSLPDNQPWFGPAGGKLPMLMGVAADEAPGPVFYGALMRSPFGDALTLDFARAAIAGEQLGQRGVPDILSISLSSHDYINHRFSAESRLSHDHLLQLDRLLQDFFADLDKTIGKGNYVTVLTADHGFMPAPEVLAAQGLLSGRLNSSQLLGRINAGLDKRFGELPSGKWALGFSSSSLLLDKKLIVLKGADPAAIAQEAKTLLLAEPAIAAAYTRAELLANRLGDAPLFNKLLKSWHPDVSGDVQYALKPNWMFGSATNVATHGSPYSYDTHVPLLIYGPGWTKKPGRLDMPVEITSIAPTLAQLLGVARPPAAEAGVLPLLLP